MEKVMYYLMQQIMVLGKVEETRQSSDVRKSNTRTHD